MSIVMETSGHEEDGVMGGTKTVKAKNDGPVVEVGTIESHKGLLTIMTNKGCFVLGFLHDIGGRIYAPRHGRVGVTAKAARVHNKKLNKSLVDYLDTCSSSGAAVGDFYFSLDHVDKGVHTWLGTTVATIVQIDGRQISFFRNDRKFVGTIGNPDEPISFYRVA